jgi:hypothetical protein
VAVDGQVVDVVGHDGWVHFIRSDGAALFFGDDEWLEPVYWPNGGSGLGYERFWVGEGYGTLCSNGETCDGGREGLDGFNAGVMPEVPAGWRLVAGSAGWHRMFYAMRRIAKGDKVDTGIDAMPGLLYGDATPVAGKPWGVHVDLDTSGVLKGGVVVVRRDGKVVGKLRLKAEPEYDSVSVPVKVSKLSKTGKTELEVQFLGTASARKSVKETVIVKKVKQPKAKAAKASK